MKASLRAALAALVLVVAPILAVADPPQSAAGLVLSANSSIYIVLDERLVSNAAPVGKTIRAHLRDAIVLRGRTFAAAGTPVRVDVVAARQAVAPDVDGTVTVHVVALDLLGGLDTLPIAFPHDLLSVETTANQRRANANADIARDIIIPFHSLYRAFRKGTNLDLRPGDALRVQTLATLDATDPNRVSISTPSPFALSTDRPYAAFTPIPLFTLAPPTPRPTPRPTPTPFTTAPPSPQPTATAQPS